MSAEDLLKSGDLHGALDALQADVRKNASDPKLRIFLFQLLCVLGQWDRALRQLKLCAELDPVAVPMAQAYREAIVCEAYRAHVFTGEKAPLVLGEPDAWLAQLIDALGLLARGDVAAAADQRAAAFDVAPATSGTVDGVAFDWIADADMRFGPVLEVIVNGRYFWIPFAKISSVTIEEPADLRDAVWLPAEVVLENGGEVAALIPTRYPATVTNGHAAEMLARATSWTDAGNGTFAGSGQRLLATSNDDLPLMDIRQITLRAVDG
ncbi:MAG: type VI secretion system accessory protein TagJ [Pseudomonadota bacterium]